jgi:hypothetical protein
MQNKPILSHSDVCVSALQQIMANHYNKIKEQKLKDQADKNRGAASGVVKQAKDLRSLDSVANLISP